MSRDPIFVVQKHKARILHYDFRLEIGGVLKSWSIPKGPSMNPSDKRMAIPTEDHPLEYASFEGIIPEGQYGAGMVIVWDKGTYFSLREDVSIDEALRQGELEIFLEGQKLKGGYALIKAGFAAKRNGRKDSKGDGRKEKPWLLIKMRDEYALNINILTEKPNSIISGKDIDDYF